MSPVQPRIVQLISGTAKTGKDTLHNLMKSGKLMFFEYSHMRFNFTHVPLWIVWPLSMLWAICWVLTHHALELFCGWNDSDTYWYVFGTGHATLDASLTGLFTSKNRRRFAFADALKTYCNSHIQSFAVDGQYHTNTWFEQHKDDRVINYDGTLVTPRQIYIQLGASQRQDDPDIWARKCFDAIDDEKTSPIAELSGESPIIDITDYRFRNECTYAKRLGSKYIIFTTKLYRGIKPSDDPSEHDLDNEIPDFLMVGSMWQYLQCLWSHPKYAYHDIIGEMVLTAGATGNKSED